MQLSGGEGGIVSVSPFGDPAIARYSRDQPSAVLRQARITSLPSRTSGFSPTLSYRHATIWRRGWDCVGLAFRRSRHRSLRSRPAFGCPSAGSNNEPGLANALGLTHPLTSSCNYLAERVGFEPTIRCRIPDFESGAFGHSATSPRGAHCIKA